ncbi:lipoprotein, partial [Vibrio furnissii]
MKKILFPLLALGVLAGCSSSLP